jgi:5'-nucleotidase (lipoprotein e(P4) family)
MRSAEARATRLQAYRRAGERLHEMAAAGQLSGDWGVILDCDETVIDNARYQRERAELGVGYSGPSWIEWVERQQATAIPGAVDFLAEVRGLGGRVVFVTNRKAQIECAPTVANLDAIGLRADAVLCRTATSDKNPRFESVADGTAAADLPPLEVVMWVGDNILDFPGLSQEMRHEQDGAFADFGDRFILIPNPMYGSWEKNEE